MDVRIRTCPESPQSQTINSRRTSRNRVGRGLQPDLARRMLKKVRSPHLFLLSARFVYFCNLFSHCGDVIAGRLPFAAVNGIAIEPVRQAAAPFCLICDVPVKLSELQYFESKVSVKYSLLKFWKDPMLRTNSS